MKKVTWFFGYRQFGFSETLYIDGETILDVYAKINRASRLRSDTLPTTVSFLGVRVQTDGQNREGRLFLPGNTPLGGTDNDMVIPASGTRPTPRTGESWDQMRACMHLEVQRAGSKLGIRYFALLPDEATGTEPVTLNRAQPANWWSAFQSWKANVIDDTWRIKSTAISGRANERAVRRWEQQVAAPNDLSAVIVGGDPLPVGEGFKVIVRGVRMRRRGLETPNGVWTIGPPTVTGTPPMQSIPLRQSAGVDPRDILSLGFIRQQIVSYPAITDLVPFRAGTHKRGRPFGTPPGRRRTSRSGNR